MHNTVGSNINVLKRISKETAKAIGTGKQLFSHDTAWVSGKVELSDNDSLSTCSTSSWIALIVVLLESDPDGGILGLRVHIIPYSRQLTRAMSD
jgi:hypothetical protein